MERKKAADTQPSTPEVRDSDVFLKNGLSEVLNKGHDLKS